RFLASNGTMHHATRLARANTFGSCATGGAAPNDGTHAATSMIGTIRLMAGFPAWGNASSLTLSTPPSIVTYSPVAVAAAGARLLCRFLFDCTAAASDDASAVGRDRSSSPRQRANRIPPLRSKPMSAFLDFVESLIYG